MLILLLYSIHHHIMHHCISSPVGWRIVATVHHVLDISNLLCRSVLNHTWIWLITHLTILLAKHGQLTRIEITVVSLCLQDSAIPSTLCVLECFSTFVTIPFEDWSGVVRGCVSDSTVNGLVH